MVKPSLGLGKVKIGILVRHFFNFEKAVPYSMVLSNFLVFYIDLVRGLVIHENFSINLI